MKCKRACSLQQAAARKTRKHLLHVYKPILLYYIQIISCTTKRGIVLAGAVQLLMNKALFQTVFILNKQGGKDNRCAKVKQCVKGTRAGESPRISCSSVQS